MVAFKIVLSLMKYLSVRYSGNSIYLKARKINLPQEIQQKSLEYREALLAKKFTKIYSDIKTNSRAKNIQNSFRVRNRSLR